ncbi:alcohol oxidase [Rhizodiscina lignyota]|uniref:Alcohol oxidase n=1 Tax=Rhizodiscina lignyota TaxID=1504668 RepID=A0A9P4ILK6_9PEZI|nr:alcohol oxidase [Rhizodiscina lignyota]
MFILPSFLLASLITTGVNARRHVPPDSPQYISHGEQYDYVIVGGGVAGLVLAARLSENPKTTVRLFEAGPDPTGDVNIDTPFFGGGLGASQFAWNFTSTPQATLGGVAPALAQGHCFGGGSAINYMGYCRGAASVYDEWAELSGITELRWNSIINVLRTNTNLKIPRPHNYSQVINASSFSGGTLDVTYERGSDLSGFEPYFVDAFLADKEYPVESADLTDGTGIGTMLGGPHTIRLSNGTREYALPAYGWLTAGRPNVKLQHGSWVKKIHFKGKRAVSVEVVNESNNSTHIVSGKEIIVSAGAINTPKLLMLSGVGPKSHLDNLGIPVIKDSPEVGSNLWDHYSAVVMVEVPEHVFTSVSLGNATLFASAEDEYHKFGRGPLATPGTSSFAAERVPDDVLRELNATFHRSLPKDRPHILYQYTVAPLVPNPTNKNPASGFVALVQPEARGHVRLNSTNYRTDPLIFSNYWGSSADFAIQLWAYKRLLSKFRGDAIAPVRVSELYPGSNVSTDAGIKRAMQQSAFSFHHPGGTVSLGKALDSSFRLKGLEGIRVVDSSAIPAPPTCHLQAPTYAVAEVAAKLIKQEDCT